MANDEMSTGRQWGSVFGLNLAICLMSFSVIGVVLGLPYFLLESVSLSALSLGVLSAQLILRRPRSPLRSVVVSFLGLISWLVVLRFLILLQSIGFQTFFSRAAQHLGIWAVIIAIGCFSWGVLVVFHTSRRIRESQMT